MNVMTQPSRPVVAVICGAVTNFVVPFLFLCGGLKLAWWYAKGIMWLWGKVF